MRPATLIHQGAQRPAARVGHQQLAAAEVQQTAAQLGHPGRRRGPCCRRGRWRGRGGRPGEPAGQAQRASIKPASMASSSRRCGRPRGAGFASACSIICPVRTAAPGRARRPAKLGQRPSPAGWAVRPCVRAYAAVPPACVVESGRYGLFGAATYSALGVGVNDAGYRLANSMDARLLAALRRHLLSKERSRASYETRTTAISPRGIDDLLDQSTFRRSIYILDLRKGSRPQVRSLVPASTERDRHHGDPPLGGDREGECPGPRRNASACPRSPSART